MGNDGGKQDSGISVAPLLLHSPGEAARELLLCVTESQGQGGAGDVWDVCTCNDFSLFSVFIPGQLPLLKIPSARYPTHCQVTMKEMR